MQTSGHHSRPSMVNKRFCQSVRKLEAYSPQLCQTLNPFGSCNKSSNGYAYPIHISQDQDQDRYCTLESSLLSTYNSPSTVTFSPNESSLSHQESQSGVAEGSPISGLDLAEDVCELKHKLKELESAMLGPEPDSGENSLPSAAVETETWRRAMIPVPRGDLKQVLVACAMAVSDNNILGVQWLMSELRQVVSVSGEPIQRLGAYMLEGLVARVSASGSSIYKSLKLREPAGFELLSYMHTLYEICPYLKFGYMAANGAIAEAMKDESEVHIIDFQIGQGSQWIPLIQAFAARPTGPPQIRITGLDDFTSAYERGGGLSIVGKRLSKIAEAFKVPFEFHAATFSNTRFHSTGLGIRPGEAVAVNFAFVLHRVPDESVTTDNRRDHLLRAVKGLRPKVVTLVERELNANTAAFYPRFREALEYYAAVFESIDAALPRGERARMDVEQHCLAREVVNVIACEGAERVERHEPLGKWRSRLRMAGFEQSPMSSMVNGTIRGLLRDKYCGKYRVEERDGALYLGWLNAHLVASSAWK
ncbi:scarecrow-like protein 21 [Andrographis paniculata]|uniref:scarecrow-like protein 21 n=1 Tax=Andrographis paniculata TaxID=175694 RepID=UPI0021E746F2|nr:scarecrow-like protein 21 [Andrographis paniculata]